MLTVLPGVEHGFRNTGPEPARGFQAHLETLDRLVRAGTIRGTRDPRSLIHMSMSAIENEPDVTIKPPQWVVRALAFAGPRLGYTLEA